MLGVAVLTWAAAQPLHAQTGPELARALQSYERGEHVQAAAQFEALARQGLPAARYNLAVMHLRGQLPAASRTEALRLMLSAAEGGFVTAMLGLGELYDSQLLGRPDLAAAYRWYLRAAEAGSVDAQVEVGTAAFLGRGTARDAAAAARWYRSAAAGGDVGAQYLIASMYEQGDGVVRDLRLARFWYDIAAKNGDTVAPAKVREIDARLAGRPG